MIALLGHDERLEDMKALLDALPIAIVVLDRTIAVRLVNSEAETVLKSRAELRLAGPTLRVRRQDEQIGFEEAIRSVFNTGNSTAFVFFSRAGAPELTIGLRLAAKVDLIMATISTAPPPSIAAQLGGAAAGGYGKGNLQATIELMQDGTIRSPAVTEATQLAAVVLAGTVGPFTDASPQPARHAANPKQQGETPP